MCDQFFSYTSPRHTAIPKFNDIHVACLEGSLEKVKSALTQRRELIDHFDQDGHTPLLISALKGSLDIVQYLVENGANVNVKKPLHMSTALGYACVHGYTAVADYLIQRGADINARDSAKWTPLHQACHSGHLDLVIMLVHGGADIHARDSLGYTAIHRACMAHDSLNIIQWLMEYAPDNKQKYIDDRTTPVSLLHLTCSTGNLDSVKYLIEHGADVLDKTDIGQTVLHKACEGGSLETVQFLVGFGLDINADDVKNRTPLHIACLHNHLDLVQYLVKAGANVDAVDKEQFSLLHIGCEYGFINIVKCLIENGASVTARSKGGYNLLHVAAREDSADIIDYLLTTNDTDLNCVTDNDSTPLHQACNWGCVQAARLLLNKGANPNAIAKSTKRPFQLCTRSMLKDIALDLVLTKVNLTELSTDLHLNMQTAPIYLTYRWAGLTPEETSDINFDDIIFKEKFEPKLEILFASYPYDLYHISISDKKPSYWEPNFCRKLGFPALKVLCRAVIRLQLGSCFSILPSGKVLLSDGYLPLPLAHYVFLTDQAIRVMDDRCITISEYFTNT